MFNKNKTLSTLRFLSYGTAFSFLSFLSFNALFPAVPSNAASSASTIADLELEIEPTIEVAVDTQNLNLAYNGETDVLPTSEGVTATGDINVYVTTNGISGYTLSLYTQNPTNEMKNVNSAVSTTIAPTIGGSTLANNTWGFQYNGSNWTAVSDDATNPSVLVSSNSANTTLCNNLSGLSGNTESLEQCVTNGSASKATVTFGANITDTLPAGRYTNDVVFSAIAKAPSAQHHYAINYNKNNAEATGYTANTSAMYPGTASTLSDGTGLTLEGMRVAGWAFTEGATEVAEVGSSNTPLTASATNIDTADLIAAAQAAGQDVSEDKSGKITLYAIWEVATRYMQDFDCSSLSANEITTLVDSRDNHEYKVKKLPDGKCWMINNLTLTATDLITEGKALTSANTNIPSSDTNLYYITPKNARYTSTGSFNNSAVASASASVNFGSSYPNYIQIGYRDKNTTDNNTGNPVPEDTAYYNFYTATLGYSYYGGGNSSGSSAMDICPKGWRLPWTSDSGTTRTTTADFYVLADSYNASASWTNKPTGNSTGDPYTTDATIRQNMIKGDASSLDPELDTNGSAGFTYAGEYYSTTLGNVGTNGYYWSSSVSNGNFGYDLVFVKSGNIYPQGNNDKNNERAVRCVAQ